MKISFVAVLQIVLTLAAFPVMALRPGDVTAKVDYNLKWLNAVPFELGKLPAAPDKSAPKLRALVFFRTRSRANAMLMPLLESTRRNAGGKLLIAAVTPDSVAEAKSFVNAYPESRVRIVADTKRRLTPLFMGGINLFPMAFLLDGDGRIIWRGEAVDLPEAVEECFGGRLSKPSVQRQITVLLDEMFQRMKTAELRPLQITAEKIFKLDPGNAAAVRLILFVLESTGKSDDIWEFCSTQLAKAPTRSRLYITALGVIKRHPALNKHLVPTISKLKENAATPEEIFAAASFLLSNFSGSADALEQTGMLLHIRDFTPEHLTNKQLQQWYSISAYYRYLTGDLPGAIAMQEMLLKKLNDQKNYPSELKSAEQRLNFYCKLLQLQKRKW